MYRLDVHDHSARPLIDERLRCALGAEDCAFQVHGHHLVVRVFIELEQTVTLLHPGVVDERIQSAELRSRRADELVDARTRRRPRAWRSNR